MTKFPCEKCGACCRSVGHLTELVSVNGVCVHLKEDNTCDDYENRPFVCRVDDIYNTVFKRNMTRDRFHAWTREYCERLKKREKDNE